MKATIHFKSWTRIIVDGTEYHVGDGKELEVDVKFHELAKLIQRGDEPQKRGPGRPPKVDGAAPKPKRKSVPRTGKSLWSGKSNFSPRWAHLTADEVSSLGVNKIPSALWKKVSTAIKAAGPEAWATARPKHEAKIKAAGDDVAKLRAAYQAIVKG